MITLFQLPGHKPFDASNGPAVSTTDLVVTQIVVTDLMVTDSIVTDSISTDLTVIDLARSTLLP